MGNKKQKVQMLDFWSDLLMKNRPEVEMRNGKIIIKKSKVRNEKFLKEQQDLFGKACWNSDETLIKLYISRGVDFQSYNDTISQVPIAYFIRNNQEHLVKLLLDSGVDINENFKAPSDSFTLLEWALKNQNKDMALFLLKRGAKISDKTEHTVNGDSVLRNKMLQYIMNNNNVNFKLWCLDYFYDNNFHAIVESFDERDSTGLKDLMSFTFNNQHVGDVLKIINLFIKSMNEYPCSEKIKKIVENSVWFVLDEESSILRLSEKAIQNLWDLMLPSNNVEKMVSLVDNGFLIDPTIWPLSLDNKSDKLSFIWSAIKKNEKELVSFLLQSQDVVQQINVDLNDIKRTHGIKAHIRNYYNHSALQEILMTADLGMLEKLLSVGVQLKDFKNQDGENVTHVRFKKDGIDEKLITLLIKTGHAHLLFQKNNLGLDVFQVLGENYGSDRVKKLRLKTEQRILNQSMAKKKNTLTKKIIRARM